VAQEVGLDRGRQHRPAVLVALAAAHHDQVGAEVHVLHAEAAALQNAKAGPVEEAGHEPRGPGEPLEHGPHLLAREDDRQALRALRAHDFVEPRQVDRQHFSVEEQEPLSAWFWVEAATRPSTARALRNPVTSGAPSSAGWRLPWKRMNRRIQAT
jgi:hypothetical protein